MATAKKPTTDKKPAAIKKTAEATKPKVAKVKTAEKIVKEPETKTEVAKAGKRSAKALKEAEELAAKEQRKAEVVKEPTESPIKPAVKPPRARLERRGKNYRKLHELIKKNKAYDLKEALELATKTSPVKFDATVELHLKLGVDPKQANQNIRDSVLLPSGSGKTVRVAVFADDQGAKDAKSAGADTAGAEVVTTMLDKNLIDFDVLIATPTLMPQLGKYARLLGPRGLMPNPKSGTVTTDVVKAVKEAKAGKVEYRVDSNGIVHVGIGKVSFGADKLIPNAEALLASVRANKPQNLKGIYLKSFFVTTSMGPSISVKTSEA
jgi:large subunit ribosomal protein L1